MRGLFLMLFSMLSVGTVNAAPILSFDPAAATATRGQSLSIDVLVDPDGEMIGGYALTLTFDPAILRFQALDFGSALGGPEDSIQDVIDNGITLDVAEVSLLEPLPQNGNPFRLFTLRFLALTVGDSLLSFSDTQLTDALGLALPASVMTGLVRVEPSPTGVSTPLISLPLMMTGLLLALARNNTIRGLT
jgi:hypothetical protein